MKRVVITLSRGGTVEITDDGVVVTSTGGDCTEFDSKGRRVFYNSPTTLDKEKFPVWFQYFDFMGEYERRLVAKWYEKQECKTEKQTTFLRRVNDALNSVNYDYRIANLEPSISGGKLYYEEDNFVCRGLNCKEWSEKAKEFAPEYESDLASLHELILWYAYRIAKEYWSIEFVCDGWVATKVMKVDKSGARKIGGARDGTGNTYKIVKVDNGFAFCGGCWCYSGIANEPVAEVNFSGSEFYSSGVVVLKK